MQGMPDPTGFDRSRMEGQAESVRANMGDSRHEEQLREAKRAKREAESAVKGVSADTFFGRIGRWFRRQG